MVLLVLISWKLILNNILMMLVLITAVSVFYLKVIVNLCTSGFDILIKLKTSVSLKNWPFRSTSGNALTQILNASHTP